jgi:hypothetical protein
MTMYFTARTTETANDASRRYTQLARARWHFDGSGSILGGQLWQAGSTAGVGGDGQFTLIKSGIAIPQFDPLEERLNDLAQKATFQQTQVP